MVKTKALISCTVSIEASLAMMKVCEKRILPLIGVLILFYYFFIFFFFGGVGGGEGGGIRDWFEVKRLYS